MTGTAFAARKTMRIFCRVIPGILALAGLGAPAHGQTTPDPQVISPLRVETEVNGVNVTTGRTTPEVPVLSVPAAPELRFDRAQNAALYVNGRIYRNFDMGGEARRFAFHLGEASDSIECFDGAPCESRSGSGAIVPPGGLVYRQAGTGIVYRFNVMHFVGATVNWERPFLFYVGSVEHPDGETLTYTYDSATLTTDQFGRTWRRPARITSNRGFYIDLTYQPGELGDIGWGTVAQATLYASADPATPLGRLTYSGNTVTDLAGRAYICTCNASLGMPTETVSASMQLPGDTAPSAQTTGHPTLNLINSVTRDGVSSTYSYSNPEFKAALSGPAGTGYSYSALTVTGSEGYHQVYNLGVNLTKGLQFVTSMTDSLGRTASYSYDRYYRVTQITYPEQNRALITYDARGNVTSQTRRAKTGSGLPDIVESANYETGNCDQVPGVLCWRPTWTRDGMLRQTDYSYNERGQLTERLDPADAGGVRRRTSILYAVSPAGISRRSEIRVCADTGATCGTNALARTQYQYWGDTELVTREQRIDGATGEMLDTVNTYDAAGRLLSTDGPLPGTADATYSRYDVHGRRTWEIGAADSSGVRPATRTTYRASDDKVVYVERGTIPAPDSAALTVLSQTETVYDGRRNPVREVLSRAGTFYNVLDRSFDDRGRLLCEAVRMNPATFLAVPDACVLGAQGTGAGDFGPDRIVRNVYDLAGRRVQRREGVGTAIEAAEATWAYNLNGQVTAVIDGNGNRAELRYDGHMRQDRWIFPHAGPGAPNQCGSVGAANPCDYEEYGYDAAGNRTSLRKRDGSTLTYQYDNLNRMIAKIVPERAGLAATHTRDVHYGYDLRNLQLYARFDSAAGEGVTSAYDAFGRLESQTINLDGVSRALSYRWDAGSRRTRVTHPDGTWFAYDYDPAGRLAGVYHFNGALMQNFLYDGAGRLWATTRAVGNATVHGYDALSRPASLSHNLPDTAADLTLGFAYNPAGQLASRTQNNDAYAWTGAYNVNRAYTTNGLNQYTAAGAATFAYDPNGNLTSDGSTSFTYDIENRLVAASGARTAALRYDPLGRLYEVGGGSGTTRFLYDGDALVAEYDAAGVRQQIYVHATGADTPFIWFAGADLRFLHADQQGSIVAASSTTANNVVAINSYDEYGIPAAGNVGRFQYTGQAWLGELGMYHYKARVYSPTLGRFLQTDPIGYQDQFNLYAYVGNDPVNATDPSGAARLCSVGTGSRLSSCVTVDADVNNDGRDDLKGWQLSRIGRDFAGFIQSHRGENISGNGKNVTGDAALHDRAMVSVASQFVGAALGNSPHWRNLSEIRAMRSGGPESGNFSHGGRWTMTVGPNFPSGNFPPGSIFGGTAWFRNTYNSPSNLARVMLHAVGHTFIGASYARENQQRVDRYARYALGQYGLAGGGCWNAAGYYHEC